MKVMINGSDQLYEFGSFRLDVGSGLLFQGSDPIALAPKIYQTLLVLVENAGRTVSKEELLSRLWPDSFVEECNVSQNIFQLRKALCEPHSDFQYIETIPKRGYRFAVAVKTINKNGDPSSNEPPETKLIVEETQTFERTSRVRSRQSFSAIAVVSCVVLILGLATAAYVFRQGRKPASADLRSLAVLPFRAINVEAHDEQLRIGMADSLISRLSRIREIKVRPTGAVLRYIDGDRDARSSGMELGVDAVLDGRIHKQGSRLTVEVQLVRVRDGTLIWSGTFDENSYDILAIENAIGDRVTAELSNKPIDETGPLTDYTTNKNAYQSYVRGRYFWNKRSNEGYQLALKHFQEAIELDPSYSLAYSGLADCYLFLAFNQADSGSGHNYERARAAAKRALELNDRLAEAYTTLAAVQSMHDKDWAQAEKTYKQAIQFNPNYSTAHHWYAWDLLVADRPEEALREMVKAQELDPLSITVNVALGQIYYYMRRYEEAISHLQRTLELDAENVSSRSFLAMAYEQKGKLTEALEEYQKALAGDGANYLALGGTAHAMAVGGKRSEALQLLARLEKSGSSPQINYQIAAIYLAIGDRQAAIRRLGKIRGSELDSVLVPLKYDPRLDRLRGDDLFESYLKTTLHSPPA